MGLQNIKTGPPAEITTGASVSVRLTRTFNTKEKIGKKTRGLWDTARQLKGLSDLLASPEGGRNDILGRRKSLIEPLSKPVDDLLELKTEAGATGLTARSHKRQKPNAVKSSGNYAVKPKDKITAEALPDITAREIINELKDIERLIREKQPGSTIEDEEQKG